MFPAISATIYVGFGTGDQPNPIQIRYQPARGAVCYIQKAAREVISDRPNGVCWEPRQGVFMALAASRGIVGAGYEKEITGLAGGIREIEGFGIGR